MSRDFSQKRIFFGGGMDFSEHFARLLGGDRGAITKLSEAIGASTGLIHSWKSGQKKPSFEYIPKLAKYFSVTIDSLFCFSYENENKSEKHPLIVDLEAVIDERLGKVESRISEEIDRRLKLIHSTRSDFGSGFIVSESDSEYDEDLNSLLFVNDLAAGPPIYQSDDLSKYIKVPARLIKTKPEDYYVGRIQGTSMTAAGIPDGCLVLIKTADVPRDGGIQIVRINGEVSLKRMKQIPGKGWKVCFNDYTGRYIDVKPCDDFQIQGDFVAVLPERLAATITIRD